MFRMLLILTLFLSVNSYSGSYSGKVQQIDLHADKWGVYNPDDKGILSLYLVGMPKSCGEEGGLNRVVITSDHPLFQSVISIALTAKISDKNLTIHYLDSCNTRSRAWDFGFVSFSE
jgi:hypothetical protein